MRAVAASFAVGLLAPLVQGRAIVTRADIEACLASSGVPYDTKGSADWARDAAPFNLRVPYTPVAISVPQTIEHISKSVICGKNLGIKVSAKSGGHSYASLGFGGEDGHLVVELDRMYNVSLAENNIAVVQPVFVWDISPPSCTPSTSAPLPTELALVSASLVTSPTVVSASARTATVLPSTLLSA